MSHPTATPTVKDFPYQLFVYSEHGKLGKGRYIEPAGHKDLTEMQRKVRSAMRKFDGNMALAAESLGVTYQNIQGHVSLIESKGWVC